MGLTVRALGAIPVPLRFDVAEAPGLTLAVLMDAFVIRGTLVPAFMRLAGKANWWAPAWLRRAHDRFGISEGERRPRTRPATVGAVAEPVPVREFEG